MAIQMNSGNMSDAVKNFDQLPDAAFIDQRAIQQIKSISAATVWRYVNAGILPKPHKFGPRMNRWNVGELRAVLAAKAA